MSRPYGKWLLVCLAFIAAASVPGAASSHSAQSGDIAIGHIWAYPSQANTGQTSSVAHKTGGATIDVFGPLLNGGGIPDAVTGVTSQNAKSAGLVMWIRGSQITSDFPLALPPGKPIALGSQTQFIRLYGLDKPSKAGDSFPITFHFQHAPDVTIAVIVQGK